MGRPNEVGTIVMSKDLELVQVPANSLPRDSSYTISSRKAEAERWFKAQVLGPRAPTHWQLYAVNRSASFQPNPVWVIMEKAQANEYGEIAP